MNENIEEKWNEGYEQTIDEALSAEQAKIYDEFLTDFGKMFKKFGKLCNLFKPANEPGIKHWIPPTSTQ